MSGAQYEALDSKRGIDDEMYDGLVFSFIEPFTDDYNEKCKVLGITHRDAVAVYGDTFIKGCKTTIGGILEENGYVEVNIAGYREIVPMIPGKSDKPKKGFIYIITDGEYVKIGLANNVKTRVNDIQVSSPKEIILLQSIEVDDMRMAESSLHYWYRKFHVRGEWFDLLPLFGLSKSDYIETMIGNNTVRHEYSYSVNFTDGRKEKNMAKIWIRK